MNKYDKMVACNRKSSDAKMQLAREAIMEMLVDCEKIYRFCLVRSIYAILL